MWTNQKKMINRQDKKAKRHRKWNWNAEECEKGHILKTTTNEKSARDWENDNKWKMVWKRQKWNDNNWENRKELENDNKRKLLGTEKTTRSLEEEKKTATTYMKRLKKYI